MKTKVHAGDQNKKEKWMSAQQDKDLYRLQQIGSIALSEPIWSILFFAHVGLHLLGSLLAAALFHIWWPAAASVLYITVFTTEKYLANRAFERRNGSQYVLVLSLITARAVVFNVIAVTVWSLDGTIFQFAALALLVAATINIMVFHATFLKIITCVVVPIWGGFTAIAFLFVQEFGGATESFAALLIVFCVTPYFFLALFSARSQHIELEQTRLALNHAQKQEVLGRLVAGVAHDFNNVLSVALANVEMLKESASQEKRNHFANEIIRATERGASLADQLLAFGQQSEMSPEKHVVFRILEDLENMVSRVFAPSIVVSKSIAKDTPALFVDRNQLDVALLNLAINAQDAMEKAGRLEIKVDSFRLARTSVGTSTDGLAPGRYVRFRFIDNGKGMDEATLQQIFNPFYTTKNAQGGSGLGLSMVSGFAKRSGGTISVHSEVNKGTTMSLLIPAASGK